MPDKHGAERALHLLSIGVSVRRLSLLIRLLPSLLAGCLFPLRAFGRISSSGSRCLALARRGLDLGPLNRWRVRLVESNGLLGGNAKQGVELLPRLHLDMFKALSRTTQLDSAPFIWCIKLSICSLGFNTWPSRNSVL